MVDESDIELCKDDEGAVEGVVYGVRLKREKAEEITGQPLHPAISTLSPSGNLVYVVVEENPDEIGSIKLPDTMPKPPAGVGHVIAAGPFAGNEMYANTPGVASIGVVCERPEQLLGLHTLFGAHTGTPLRLSFLERRFSGQVLLMTSRDLMGTDSDPRSLIERSQEEYSNRAEAQSLIQSA